MTDIITDAIHSERVEIVAMHEKWLDIGDHENYK